MEKSQIFTCKFSCAHDVNSVWSLGIFFIRSCFNRFILTIFFDPNFHPIRSFIRWVFHPIRSSEDIRPILLKSFIFIRPNLEKKKNVSSYPVLVIGSVPSYPVLVTWSVRPATFLYDNLILSDLAWKLSFTKTIWSFEFLSRTGKTPSFDNPEFLPLGRLAQD